MTFAQLDASRSRREGGTPDRETGLETWFGARARRVLGMTALVILVGWLVVLATQAPEPTELSADRSAEALELESDRQPVFDGRGKWTGYLPY